MADTVSGQADDANSGLIWVKSLSLLPKILYPNIQEHLKGCSKKNIGEKGYKYFVESYIHDVHVAVIPGRTQVSKVKARCYRSQKKSETPHSMELDVCGNGGDEGGQTKILKAKCSCKAG